MSESSDTLTPPPGRPVDAGYQLQWGDDIPTDFSFSSIEGLPTPEEPSLLDPENYQASPDAPPLQDWAPGLPSTPPSAPVELAYWLSESNRLGQAGYLGDTGRSRKNFSVITDPKQSAAYLRGGGQGDRENPAGGRARSWRRLFFGGLAIGRVNPSLREHWEIIYREFYATGGVVSCLIGVI